ncbi:UbiA prenyltransferase family-domain-containing protein [Dendryphion nanum]|uniref:UbiA prenyltransferase family-domain-containing protein n=1 Tax=Dendryphion nanum TaxID=256645 RepID=A0A9P9EJK3_9PLEO|nr:UbiA prenyltransferase family-domain-containing protein [Dendryphion nanum]
MVNRLHDQHVGGLIRKGSHQARRKVWRLYQRAGAESLNIKEIPYHLKTLWLFTSDQVPDVLLPCTAIALSAALAGNTFQLPNQTISVLLARTLSIWAWLWFMVLHCCMYNQRQPSSVEEDAVNKPWRPLPAGRISPSTVNRLIVCIYPLGAVLSYSFGVVSIWLVFSVACIAYNDFGGADSNFIIRYALNGVAYACFFSSALQVAVGSNYLISSSAWQWLALLVLVIVTTTHAQDFRDEKGDSMRGRHTVISVFGNTGARILLVCAIAFWSVYIPQWLGVRTKAAVFVWSVGFRVIFLTLKGVGKGDAKLDRKMYRLWGVWMLVFGIIPLTTAWS